MTTRTTSSTGFHNIQDNPGRWIVAWYRQSIRQNGNSPQPRSGTLRVRCNYPLYETHGIGHRPDLIPILLLGWLESVSDDFVSVDTVNPRPHMRRGGSEMKGTELPPGLAYFGPLPPAS
jgi:hypothetical protein